MAKPLEAADAADGPWANPAGPAESAVASPRPDAASADAELPNIVVDPAADGPWSRLRGRRTGGESTGASRPMIGRVVWLAAGGIVAAALVVLIAVVLVEGRSSGGPPQAVLTLDWPTGERSGAAVFIDGRRRGLPESGPVEYSLKPGSYRLVLLRRGYRQVEQQVSLQPDQRLEVKPLWVRSRVAAFDPTQSAVPDRAWLQDLDEAKRRAAQQNKDVLIVFEGSDWDEQSMRMRTEVLSRREFREQIDWRFVLVSIDFPRNAEARQRVDDPQRNQQIAESYGVSEYPRVVLTDSAGRPYAIEGYSWRGVESFVARASHWQSVREQRDRLFLSVEVAEGDGRLTAIVEAAELLKGTGLVRFYRSTLDAWLALVEQHDADNRSGAYEAVFEVIWLGELAEEGEEDPEALRGAIAKLEDWKRQFEFKDADRAASMHLCVAAALAAAEQDEEALVYVRQANDYHPTDPALLLMLEQAEATLRGYGTGTGFAVAADGHILTNYHVVEEEVEYSVQLPGLPQPVPAAVVAKDTERDIALLKVQLPEGIELGPLHITVEEIRRGAGVGVFGFPGGEATGTGLKLTTGVISAEPQQSDQGMYLLDCRVNPGNSGGPLCDTRGNVVGMVSRKLTGLGVDSYGMALPGQDLEDFLKQHLPQYERQHATEPSQTRLEWDEIDQLVSPSVVMIIR